MKKLSLLSSVLLIISLGLFSFSAIKLGAISGKISPQNGAASVSIIVGLDTIKAPLNQGNFKFINLKQGVYTIAIKAVPPYKDALINKVAVKDSATTDMGEIKLLQ